MAIFGFNFALRVAAAKGLLTGAITPAKRNTIVAGINSAEASGELESLTYDLLAADGHFTTADGTQQPLTAINWSNLIALLLQYLPQIIAIIEALLNPTPAPTLALGSGLRSGRARLASLVCLSFVSGLMLWGSLVLAQAPQPVKPVVGPVAAMQPDLTHARGYKSPDNLAQMKRDKFKENGAKFAMAMKKSLPDQYMSPFQIAQQDQGNCHPRGTMIRMADGTERPIENIHKGDRIMGGDGAPVKVLWASSRIVVEPLWTIATESGKKLPATAEHLILTRRGYVPAKWVWAGDEVSRGDDHFEFVTSVSRNALFGGEVFNLDVSRCQTYFANGIVCHNCGDCWCVSASVLASMAFVSNGTFKPYSPTLTDGSNVISPNSTMSCTSTGGCNGDDASTVFKQGQTTGLSTIACYGPYDQSNRMACNASCQTFKLSNWGYADGTGDGSSTFDEICTAIYEKGGVILTNDADALGDGTQVVTAPGRGTDHQICGVGFDRVKKIIWGKNQWGNWGQSIAGQPGPGYVPIGVLSDGQTMAASCSSEVLWCEAGTGPVPVPPPGPTPVPPGPLPVPPVSGNYLVFNGVTYTVNDPAAGVFVANADVATVLTNTTSTQAVINAYTVVPTPAPPLPIGSEVAKGGYWPPQPNPYPRAQAGSVIEWGIMLWDPNTVTPAQTALINDTAYWKKTWGGNFVAYRIDDPKATPFLAVEPAGAGFLVENGAIATGNRVLTKSVLSPSSESDATALFNAYQSP